jgi:hypothetical protein
MPAKADKPAKTDKPAKADKPAKTDKPAKADKSINGKKPSRTLGYYTTTSSKPANVTVTGTAGKPAASYPPNATKPAVPASNQTVGSKPATPA